MGLIFTILIGFVVGAVAKWFMPGKDNGGFFVTALLGIAGSWLGSIVLGHRAGFIGSVIGAILVLVIYRFMNKKET
jgi:uncharacterized membrane protein YeaQ/YmgE (transglycosylase-associated protein family)